MPSEWILRDMKPDYGLDKELTIVEGEDVSNKVVWLQLKATEKLTPNQKTISYDFETRHLKFWETCRLPVIVLYWIKSSNEFYYLFAQRYIKEVLSPSKSEWRNQTTVSVTFPLESKLVDTESLTAIATEGHLYVMQQQLEREAGPGPHYWLDGIPQSDNTKLKEYTLQALLCSLEENHRGAIDQLEKALRLLTIEPTEKMSLLLNLGNSYLSLSQNEEALKNYQGMLELADRVPEKEALEGKANALAGIGLIYRAKGDLDQALKYHKDALKMHRGIGYKPGEAQDLIAVGLVLAARGKFDQALSHYEAAVEIHREIGFKKGEATALGNIGLVYSAKGDLDQALKYHKDALRIDREIGYKEGEADDLGNIGNVNYLKGDLDQAFKHLNQALKMFEEMGMPEQIGIAKTNIERISQQINQK